MRNNRILLLAPIVFILICFFVGAQDEEQSGGVSKLLNSVYIEQVCTNETAFCDFCNVTKLTYPNGSSIFANLVMTKNGGQFNYTLDKTYTQVAGDYTVFGFCTAGFQYQPFSYDFTINGAGDTLTTSTAILYGIFLLFVVFFFIFCLWGAIITPYQNERDEEGKVYLITRKKYIKFFLMVMTYTFFVLILWILWNISYGYFNNVILSSFFRYAFWIAFVFSFPVTVMAGVLVIMNFFKDMDLNDRIRRGFEVW